MGIREQVMWSKLNQYCMTKDDYMITKYFMNGGAVYVLYKQNYRVGMYASFEEAKSHAK